MLTIILILLIILIIDLLSVESDRKRDHREIVTQIEDLNNELNSIRNDLKKIGKDVEEMSLTECERENRAFNNAPNLDISFFEKMEKDRIINLISGSWYYPSDEIFINRFQYKHDHVDKENKTEFGWEVYGFQRFLACDEWTPCTFFANEKECMTLSCEGTIKKSI
ncbi:MAG: hypothetical protein JW787_03505 [Sedimentisphaerales bacterium]|nr:hypothetical protein [Sedimentisphaerales bacterium]